MAQLGKILLLAEANSMNSSSLGTLDLARALASRGLDVVTIASAGPTMVEKFRKAGLPLRCYYRIQRKTLPYILNHKIIRLAEAAEPDIIHACSPRLSSLAARLARACRVKYVVTAGNAAECRCNMKCTRRFGGLIATSQFLREWIVNSGIIPKEAITVIHSGVEVELFERMPEPAMPLRWPQRDFRREKAPAPSPQACAPVVGMIGKFASGAGHDCFLNAAKRIAGEMPEVQFIIAGDGPGRYVRDRLEKAGLVKRTTILPAFLDFRHLLASIDVLLVPGVAEGQSRLILDAMASRRPVIATGVGDNYEVIKDGENGLLVPRNDCEAFAAKTLRVLKDSAFCRQITSSAFESVRNHFSLARMANDTIAFYDHALTEELV
ncbi:MAG TPA: glycosyltransferase family 4 protein [Planctomycetota bacterium]|nr:glycosyltransferase family 4 protein [Planctomycetota bacterium]